MADILTMLSAADQLDFSRNFSVARPAYLGNTIFPDIKTQNFKAEYLRLAAGDHLPTIAPIHALDTEAHIASRRVLERVTVEKLLIKDKINQSEQMQLARENGVFDDDALVEYIFDDWARLAENVICRTEAAKMEVLSSGKMTINENGIKMSVDFGVPIANTAHTVDASTADKNVLAQIQAVVDAAKDKGMAITGMVTSSAVIGKLLANTGISTAVHGGAASGAMVTRTQLRTLFNELFGFSDIRENDARYNVEDKTGKKTTARYFPQNKISFVASYNGLQGFGSGLWGVTPEELAQGPWTAKSAEQYVTLTQWQEPDPVAVWSKASALFIPVLPNPEGLFVATVTL